MQQPSSSGLSSPQRHAAPRSDPTLSSTPRSPRTSQLNQPLHQAHIGSQSGSKPRAVDLDDSRCLSHRPSRKCLKCERDTRSATAGLLPIQSGLDASSSRRKVRTRRRGSGSPYNEPDNEAPHADSHSSPRSTRSHSHQRSANRPFDPRQSTRRLTSETVVKAPALASPASLSPVFPLPSPLSFPSTSPRQLRNRPRLLTKVSSSPFASASPSPLSRCIPPPSPGYSTPSPPTRSRKSRSFSSVSSSPLRPPTLSFLIRDGCPPRAPATLAMSMQIHAPSPIMSTRTTSPPSNTRTLARPNSRPVSPLSPSSPLSRPPMPRPPSRSEKLLRDTLRKAEEQDRILSLSSLPTPSTFGATQPAHGFFAASPPSTPAGHRIRRGTASSVGTDTSADAFAYCDTGACYSDDEQDEVDQKRWLWRSPSTSSSSSAHGYQTQSRPHVPSRHHGDDLEKRPAAWRSRAHSDVVHGEHADQSTSAYGSLASSSPRTQVRRHGRSSSSVTRPPLSHAHSHSHSHSHARSSRNSIDGDRPCAYTPHEAVLRSRLEGVLRGAQAYGRRESLELGGGSGSGGSSNSNSFASSRNMSGEGEMFFAAGEAAMTFSPASHASDPVSGSRARTNTSATAPGPANMYMHRRASTTARSPKSSTRPHGIDPLTPPPSPPFNAVTAAEQCKAMDGYVSFANIAGLGVPAGEEEEEAAEAAPHNRWLKWFSLGSRHAEGAASR